MKVISVKVGDKVIITIQLDRHEASLLADVLTETDPESMCAEISRQNRSAIKMADKA